MKIIIRTKWLEITPGVRIMVYYGLNHVKGWIAGNEGKKNAGKYLPY